MQFFLTSDPFRGKNSRRFNISLGLLVALTSIFFLTGCKKSQPSVVQAQPVEETNQAPAAATPPAPQYAPAPVVVAATSGGGADLKQLNQAYMGWIVQNRRRPKSFDEFVALSGIKIPPPPAGKKYAIDKYGYINLADN